MADLNRVYLIGNLTRDPEVRYTPNGNAVGDLRLAVNRRYQTRDGQEQEETCFVSIEVWGRQAETCRDYLRKGSPILVEGRLKYDQWEKDGQKHSRLSVRAVRVQFLGSPRGAELRDAPPDAGGAPEPAPSPSPEAAPSPAPAPAAGSEAPKPPANLNDTADDDNLPF